MTDTDKCNTLAAAMKDWAAEARAFDASRQAILAENRAAIFDALEGHNIETVTAVFDGYGDSGQIEDVAHTGGGADDLAAIHIALKVAVWGKDTVETVTVPLRTAIEDIAYALLERTHCGWEINEGGFGAFVFDVPARTITLDFNERYACHTNHFHEF